MSLLELLSIPISAALGGTVAYVGGGITMHRELRKKWRMTRPEYRARIRQLRAEIRAEKRAGKR